MKKRLLIYCIALGIASGGTFVFGQALEFVHFQQNYPDHFPAVALTGLDPAISTTIPSTTFMTFAFPPSPKSSAAFFDLRASALYKWSNLLERNGICNVLFRLISDVIPPNIEVSNGTQLFGIGEKNVGGNYDDPGTRRQFRAEQLAMRRDRVDFWMIRDKTTGQFIPDQEAIALLNRLLDEGFLVEFYATGYIQGATIFQVRTVSVQVTRVAKAKD